MSPGTLSLPSDSGIFLSADGDGKITMVVAKPYDGLEPGIYVVDPTSIDPATGITYYIPVTVLDLTRFDEFVTRVTAIDMETVTGG